MWPPTRQEVVAMIASYGDRRPEDVGERIDSLEMAWLLHATEQRYAVEIDVDDRALARLSTVGGAVSFFREVSRGDHAR